MAQTHDIMAYLIANYPHKHELSNARLTKMIYLADWRHALTVGKQISEIDWFFDNYGPFVWDVLEVARRREDLFTVEHAVNFFGGPKVLVGLRNADYQPKVSQVERESLDHVISQTAPLLFDTFINLVYSTYPILKCDRYTKLDLVRLAREYKNQSLRAVGA